MISTPARCRGRKGVSTVFAVLCLVALLSVAALAVDMGYVYNAHGELRRCADAAALAACWEMGEQYSLGSNDVSTPVRSAATSLAGSNSVCNAFPNLDVSDIQMGYLSDFTDPTLPLDTSNPADFNAVTITVRRTEALNGPIGTFFGSGNWD